MNSRPFLELSTFGVLRQIDCEQVPTVSVLISTNKHQSFLPMTLASLAAVPDVDIEVLVFDDTAKGDLELPDLAPPVVRVIRRGSSDSRGLGYARSRMLREASGEVSIVMDDDFIVDPRVIRDLASVHECVAADVVAAAPLYMVDKRLGTELSPSALFEVCRSQSLGALASAFLSDSHYTVRTYGQQLNLPPDMRDQTLLSGHSSFVSFRTSMPRRLGFDYLPIPRAEDSAFGDAALTAGAGFVWCQGSYALHLGSTEMDRLRADEDEFQRYEAWRRSATFGWLPTSARFNVMADRGLGRSWARPSSAVCLFLGEMDRTQVGSLSDALSRWGVRDWVACVADYDLLSSDAAAVVDQWLLDDARVLRPDVFAVERMQCAWQFVVKPVSFDDVESLVGPLVGDGLSGLHRQSGWQTPSGFAVRTSVAAFLQGRHGESVHVSGVDSEHRSGHWPAPSPSDLKRLQAEGEAAYAVVDVLGMTLAVEGQVPSSLLVELALPPDRGLANMGLGDRRLSLRVVNESEGSGQSKTSWWAAKAAQRGALVILGDDQQGSPSEYLDWRVAQKRKFLELCWSPAVNDVEFGVCITTKRPSMWSNIIANLERQEHPPASLTIICHGWQPTKYQQRALSVAADTGSCSVSAVPSDDPFGDVWASLLSRQSAAEWMVKMDDDDIYGRHFLRELATHITLNPTAGALGMQAEFIESSTSDRRDLVQRSIGWQRVRGRYQPGAPAGGALSFRVSLIQGARVLADASTYADDAMIGESLNALGCYTVVVDGLGWMVRRMDSHDHLHAWTPGGDATLRSWTHRGYGSYVDFLLNG